MSVFAKLSTIFIFVIILNETVSKRVTMDDYCKYNIKNTPCKTSCHRSKHCGNSVPYKSFNNEERNYIVHLHNTIRNNVAIGRFLYPPNNKKNKKLPPAMDMQALSYDLEAEFLAGCQAKQCELRTTDISISHRGIKMNQEFYTETNLKDSANDTLEFLNHSVTHFLKDLSTRPYNINEVLLEYKARHGLRTLTQLIWADTLYVGCAKMKSVPIPGMFTTEFYCNYYPAGNEEETRVYSFGASSCVDNEEYEVLCGIIRPLEEDTFVPPMSLDNGISAQISKIILLSHVIITVLNV